ncbi:MMPL family transporter, partial [candidate division KSB1 bacterium]|nr:MMPL family transporter [candidate division KSB1 bacterium]
SLPDSDPDAVLLKQIGEKFGGNRIGMVILETDDVFTTEVLSHVRQITDSIKEMEYISSVTSITNIMDINGGEFGLEVGALVDPYELPSGKKELDKLKKRVYSKELFKGTIVSEDGMATIIIFTLYDDADIQVVARDVREKTLAFNFPEKIYFAGNPMLVTSISALIRKDLFLLIPVTFLVIAIVLFFGFLTRWRNGCPKKTGINALLQ